MLGDQAIQLGSDWCISFQSLLSKAGVRQVFERSDGKASGRSIAMQDDARCHHTKSVPDILHTMAA